MDGHVEGEAEEGHSEGEIFQLWRDGHYASWSPLKKKEKDEKHDPKATLTKIDEDEFAMSAHASPGGKWGNIEL